MDKEIHETEYEFFNFKETSPTSWKLWHSCTLLLSSLLFTYASTGYLSCFVERIHGEETGGWILAAGSLLILIANESEWCVYRFKQNRINHPKVSSSSLDWEFFFIHLGGFLFLIGGILFTPVAQSSLYSKFIPIGGFILFFSYLSKHSKQITENDSSIKKADILTALSFLIYAIGGILLSSVSDEYLDLVTISYIVAGVLLIIASSMLIKGYFTDIPRNKENDYKRIN